MMDCAFKMVDFALKMTEPDAGAMFEHVDETQFTQFFCYWMELGLAKQRAAMVSGPC